MKPFSLHLVVNSMQSTNRDDSDAPTKVVLVSSDPKLPNHVPILVHDKADLDGLETGKAIDVTFAAAKEAPAAVASPAPIPPKAS